MTPKTETPSSETPTPTTPTMTPKTETPSTETPTPTTPTMTPKTETPSTETPPTTPTTTPKTDTTPTEPPTTTQSPGVSSQTTSSGPQDPCKPNPCGASASCVNLNTEWFCMCPEGYYYQNESTTCKKGKTFPGEIGVKVTETTGLDNKTSPAYQALYRKVVKFFENALNKTKFGFGQTIIIKVSVSSSQSTRSAMRAADWTIVNVSVVNMFNENTKQNESTISAIIKEAVINDTSMENYTEEDRCDYYGCEKNAEDCQNPLQCTCKPGFTRSSPQNSFCLQQDRCDYYGCEQNEENCQDPLQCKCQSGMSRPSPLVPFCTTARECPGSCSAADRKQCLRRDNGALECACMPDYQKSTDGKCEACPFGYSGQDCKDPFQLILTILPGKGCYHPLPIDMCPVGSTFSKNKKKNVEEQKLIDEDFQNVRMQQTGFSNSGFSNSRFSNSGFSNNSDFSNFGAGNSIFPKVKTQNPYANQRSMPRPDY
ncbi:mucin-13 [Microtus ochrogaster]|uniref:Mucin-13 n=1 Tax=Microtus ochrogaster TaxID=79684 RepID=A0ABM1AQV4_MICOH|nr:mucin-13 [Microtus ochrogaster]